MIIDAKTCMVKYGSWTSPTGTYVYLDLFESMVQKRNGFT